MKRFVVALVGLAVLAVAAWIVVRQQDREARIARAEARLLSFDERAVVGVTLALDGAAWRFRRQDDGWRLVSPVEDRADAGVMRELLATLRQTRVERVIGTPDALAEYGLDPPRLAVRLEGVDAPALSVGSASPTRDGLYVMVEGRPGVLVLNLLEALLLNRLEPEGLRDHRLSGVVRAGITGVTLRRGAEMVRIERAGETWWITEPLRLPAEQQQVERLLTALEETAVAGFVDGADPREPRFGLGDGAVEVILRSADETLELRFGAVVPEGGRRYALRAGRAGVLVTDRDPLADAPTSPRELASSRLTEVNRYQVTRFSYRKGTAELAAVRAAEREWQTAAGAALPSERIYALLATALNARVADWRPGSPAGETPRASLEFELEDGTTDRIDFLSGNRARLQSLPGLVYELAAGPPELPRRDG